jgi:Flp pilus assembly protein TadD
MLKSLVIAIAVVACLTSVPALAAGSDSSSSSNTEPGEVKQSRTLLKDGNYAKAEGLLRQALAADADNADAWNLLGYATRMQGDNPEAEEYYGKALALNRKHVGALQYLGMLYVQTGRIDEAKKLLARIDDACLFTCDEYTDLKRAIETGKTDKSPNW